MNNAFGEDEIAFACGEVAAEYAGIINDLSEEHARVTMTLQQLYLAAKRFRAECVCHEDNYVTRDLDKILAEVEPMMPLVTCNHSC
jgi:hypothetical protein